MDKLPTVEAILERQAKAWELNQRLSEKETGTPREGPWITISREHGSNGTELAQRLGAQLGWQVFDREILSTIAEHTHTRQTVLSQLDERAIGPLIDYIARVLNPEIPGHTDFQRAMLRVIWGLAKQGNAIIVGRGANWFLDPRYGVRLRVVAPLELRIARVARQAGVDTTEAERRVQDNDARQEQYVRRVFGRAINDPQGYDLVLNLGLIDLDRATRTVLAAMDRPG